jgi:protein tyrosine phosphatase
MKGPSILVDLLYMSPSDYINREPINAKKNIDAKSVPYDYNRVRLVRKDEPEQENDYSNASLVDAGGGQNNR